MYVEWHSASEWLCGVARTRGIRLDWINPISWVCLMHQKDNNKNGGQVLKTSTLTASTHNHSAVENACPFVG
jgi:hypothetical protein